MQYTVLLSKQPDAPWRASVTHERAFQNSQVGMAVHDDGEDSRNPRKPGHVFSIDPRLGIPEQSEVMRL